MNRPKKRENRARRTITQGDKRLLHRLQEYREWLEEQGERQGKIDGSFPKFNTFGYLVNVCWGERLRGYGEALQVDEWWMYRLCLKAGFPVEWLEDGKMDGWLLANKPYESKAEDPE